MSAQTLAERRQMEKGSCSCRRSEPTRRSFGLFGTVVGVLQAFDALGSATSNASALAPQAVMGSIAEALVATAVGLGVAIPAVMAFNVFQRMVRSLTEDARFVTRGSVVCKSQVCCTHTGECRECQRSGKQKRRDRSSQQQSRPSFAPSHSAPHFGLIDTTPLFCEECHGCHYI